MIRAVFIKNIYKYYLRHKVFDQEKLDVGFLIYHRNRAVFKLRGNLFQSKYWMAR